MLIANLNEQERALLIMALQETKYECLVAFDPTDQAFKVKIDNGIWSPPLGIFQRPTLAESRQFIEDLNEFGATIAHEWYKEMHG